MNPTAEMLMKAIWADVFVGRLGHPRRISPLRVVAKEFTNENSS